MSQLELPVRSDFKKYEHTLELEGTTYSFSYTFNRRSNRWSMSILDINGAVVLGGVPILVDIDLTSQYIQENLPPGGFVPINETGTGKNPEIIDLGNDVKMIYVESEAA